MKTIVNRKSCHLICCVLRQQKRGGEQMKGKLIVLEGTDCSGKETQSNLLVEQLNRSGFKTAKYAFPNYNSPTGKIIAGPYLGKKGFEPAVFPEGASNVDPYCASLLFAMDRKYNIKDVNNLLNSGINVVLDRYIDSNMAHHGAKLDKKERDDFYNFIETLEYQLLKLPKPDLEIFLHMPIWASKILKSKRAEIPDQHEKDEKYLVKSEEAYYEIINRHKVKIIECTHSNNIKEINEINKELCNIVLKNLNEKP